jgi:MscS family membrane protein
MQKSFGTQAPESARPAAGKTLIIDYKYLQNFLIMVLLLLSFDLRAQEVDLSNPRATMTVFVENTDPSNFKPKEAAKIIQSKGLFGRSAKRVEHVQMLKQILDKDSVHIDLDGVPDDPNYEGPNNPGLNVYVITENIFLEKVGQKWYLSKASVDSLEVMHTRAGLVKPKKLAEKKPAVQAVKTSPSAQRVYVDLSTPKKTVKVFLVNTEPGNENLRMASRIIYRRHLTSESDRINRIEMLSRFLSGTGVLIDLTEIPDDPDYTDSLNMDKAEYELTYRFPELYLEKIGSNWYLAKHSVEVLPALYKQKFPFGTDRLFQFLPEATKKEVGLLKVWQYGGILLLTILGFLANKFFAFLTNYVLVRVMARFKLKDITNKYIKPIVRPVGYLLVVYFISVFIPILMLPVKITHYISILVAILGPLFLTLAFYRLSDVIGLLLVQRAIRSENAMDDQLAPIIRKALKTFVVISGFIFILQNLNIDIVPLLAGLSIGGLALALAAQDTIKHFFGSVMIFLDKPFQVGQWITSSNGIDGTVEEVGIRATRIRTFRNSVIYVPNGQLADSVIDNHGMRAYRRFKTTIALTYDTPPELMELYIKGLRKIVAEHPHTRKDQYHIYLNSMGSHSLDIMFYIFFKTPSWGEELTFRHEIIMAIIKLAHKLGVHFAFPTQTLHVENLPGQPSLSPNYEDPETLRSEMDEYFKSNKNQTKT